MGIYAAPPNQRRPRTRTSNLVNWIAVTLAVAAVMTFGLVGCGGLENAWLAVALGEALAALALLIRQG
jgi:hypothetical protein